MRGPWLFLSGVPQELVLSLSRRFWRSLMWHMWQRCYTNCACYQFPSVSNSRFLVITFKALHCMGPHSCQWNRSTSDPINQGILGGRWLWGGGLREEPFCCGSCPLQYSPIGGEVHPHTPGLPKNLKIWLCCQAWDPNRGMLYWGWMRG